jgi:phospholipase D1/2
MEAADRNGLRWPGGNIRMQHHECNQGPDGLRRRFREENHLPRRTDASSDGKSGVLTPEVNCWRVVRADHCALLIDGEAYFKAVRDTIGKAHRSVFILGWDIDSGVRMVRGDSRDARPSSLIDFILHTLKRRRKLHVHVLVWDFSMIFALDREWPPIYNPRWRTRRRLHFSMDGKHPPAASHHQKVVVVDDSVAFLGGIDLTRRRWDTQEHVPGHPERVDPSGKRYPPFHDVQLVVEGEAARALGEFARERWRRATGWNPVTTADGNSGTDLWPNGVGPEFRNVDVGIARTKPAHLEEPEVREIEKLYLDSIAAARRSIYIENQFFTSAAVGDAIASRLREDDGPEVVVIMPRHKEGWLEKHTMEVLRSRLLKKLRKADVHKRLGVFYPHVEGLGKDDSIVVHSKLMIVDDRLLRVGSANLSNRSMGLDTECDLCIEAAGDEETSIAIWASLCRLLGEHLAKGEKEIREVIKGKGGVLPAIESLQGAKHTLRRLDGIVPDSIDRMVPDSALVDPEKPIDPDTLLEMFLGDEPPPGVQKRFAGAVGMLVGLLALAAAWRWTPLGDWLTVDRLVLLSGEISENPWGFPLALGTFVVGSMLAIPVTLLIAASAVIFGPGYGFLCSLLGSVLSAVVNFGIGQSLGRDAIRRLAGKRINRLSARLSRRGLLTVTAMRIIPVAPFAVVNLVAGASHIRFRDFFLGTLLGMAPGTLALSFFADGLFAVVRMPTAGNVAWIGMIAAILLGSGFLFYRWIPDRENKHTGMGED